MRGERTAAAATGVAVTVVPQLLAGVPGTASGRAGVACFAAAGALLGLWRTRPRVVLLLGGLLLLVPLFSGADPPPLSLVLLLLYAFVAGDRFAGRSAWLGLGWYAGFTALVYAATGDTSPGFVILTLPGFVAGTALRLRREEAERLAVRAAEVETERELVADLAVRHERTRIAAELHDIVGHALSVMVIQAAAGQRVVDAAPAAAGESLTAIAEAARGGREDLRRLVDLLGGLPALTPDLSLVDELVERAVRSGLDVTCRLEGTRDGVPAELQHVAFRVVQEGLTNALRHAPGSAVRVAVVGLGRGLRVSVDNDVPASPGGASLLGTGTGLAGLRERVVSLGGTFAAGPAGSGWSLRAELPATA